MWVLIPKQDPNPSKPPQITPKIALFDPNFTFRFPKSHKNPGVGGWENRFGETFPKLLGGSPKLTWEKIPHFPVSFNLGKPPQNKTGFIW